MSGLVKLVKKVFKPIVNAVKKVFKSKIFKVIAVAAAVVFTGGAALGALGAAGAGGIGSVLSAGFQAGLSALGNMGSAIWTGMKAAGTAIKGFMGSLGQSLGVTAPANSMIAPGTELAANAALSDAAISGAAGGAAGGGGLLSSPFAKVAAINTAGNVVSGYAQGKAAEEQRDYQEHQRKSQDRYGLDSYGNQGDLVDPTARLKEITQHQNPNLSPVSLNNAPTVAAPTVEAPTSLADAMKKKLLASLDSPSMSQGAT